MMMITTTTTIGTPITTCLSETMVNTTPKTIMANGPAHHGRTPR